MIMVGETRLDGLWWIKWTMSSRPSDVHAGPAQTHAYAALRTLMRMRTQPCVLSPALAKKLV